MTRADSVRDHRKSWQRPIVCGPKPASLKQQSYMRVLAEGSFTFTEGDVFCSRHAGFWITRVRSRSKRGRRTM